MAWQEFCKYRGKPEFQLVWLSKAQPKNNTFPPRISQTDIENRPLQEIIQRFGVVQSKDNTLLYLLLSCELQNNGSDSEVSVQLASYCFLATYLHPYFTPEASESSPTISNIYSVLFPRLLSSSRNAYNQIRERIMAKVQVARQTLRLSRSQLIRDGELPGETALSVVSILNVSQMIHHLYEEPSSCRPLGA